MHIKLDVSHHGGSKGMIECDVADNGATTIAASLMSSLLSLGVAGYPTIIVTRSTTGSASIEVGRVDLVVSAVVEQAVIIPGQVSCTEDTQCPTGKKCQSDFVCR